MRIGFRIICWLLHLFVVGPFVGSDSSCSVAESVTGSNQKLDDLIKRSSYNQTKQLLGNKLIFEANILQ